jgi:hypothetical protein
LPVLIREFPQSAMWRKILISKGLRGLLTVIRVEQTTQVLLQ